MTYDDLTPIEKFTNGVRAAEIMRRAVGRGRWLRKQHPVQREIRRRQNVADLCQNLDRAREQYAIDGRYVEVRHYDLKRITQYAVMLDRWYDPDPRSARRRWSSPA